MSTESQAARFGRYVLARRVNELDVNQDEVHAAGGPSDSWLTVIENGRLETLSRATARKLDKGLHWVPGSARTTWDGGEPTPLHEGIDNAEDSDKVRRYLEAAPTDEVTKQRLLRALDAG